MLTAKPRKFNAIVSFTVPISAQVKILYIRLQTKFLDHYKYKFSYLKNPSRSVIYCIEDYICKVYPHHIHYLLSSFTLLFLFKAFNPSPPHSYM